MMDWSINLEKSLYNEARRLSEILTEMGLIGINFEGFANRIDAKARLEELMKNGFLEEIRWPYFFAFNLIEEALSLIKLLSARIAMIESGEGKSRDENLQRKIDNIKGVINEIEPNLHQALENIAPWSRMDGKKIAEAIAERAAAKKK